MRALFARISFELLRCPHTVACHCRPRRVTEEPARARRMRERNRIAQQRYRNRQRFRLQESEQRVAELTERVRVLTSDKVRVYFRA